MFTALHILDGIPKIKSGPCYTYITGLDLNPKIGVKY